MPSHFKVLVGFLVALIATNIIGLSIVIYSRENHLTHDATENGKIDVSFNILDIYRIDMSCDYIQTALEGQVSDRFANRGKKCSFSSLNPKVNQMLEKSILQPRNPNTPSYSPILAANYDPFLEKEAAQPQFQKLLAGGVFKPTFAAAKDFGSSECNEANIDNIVFVVPYTANRFENLRLFLLNMHAYLQTAKHAFTYRIVVAEQVNLERSAGFNKGRLYNAAVKYVIDTAANEEAVDCIVLHDVDLIPAEASESLGERGDYRCRPMPWHLSQKVLHLESNRTRVYNQFLTGGILSMRVGHFIEANGFSNEYFGWGGEDDDFQLRMFNVNLCITRPNAKETELNPAAILMLKHGRSKSNNNRFKALQSALVKQRRDGLSNIHKLARLTQVKSFKAFTHLSIKI